MSDTSIVAPVQTVDAPDARQTAAPEEPRNDNEGVDPLSPGAVDQEFAAELADAQAEAGEGEPQAELEEIEWDGKKFLAPKGLKDGLRGGEEIGREKQAIAEVQRALQEREKAITAFQKDAEADVDARAQLFALKQQIDFYKRVDWQQWVASDPVAAQQGRMAYDDALREAQRLDGEMKERGAKRSQEAEKAAREDLASRLRATEEFTKKNIPDWSPEVDRKVVDFALSQGVGKEDLANAMNPVIYNILYKAMQFDTLSKKPAAVATGQKPVPLKTVGAKGGAPAESRVEDIKDMDRYVAARKKQLAAHSR